MVDNAAEPTALIINASTSSHQHDSNLLKKPTKMLIDTGNIANWNSLKSRRSQLPANELYESLKTTLINWTKNDDHIKNGNDINCQPDESYDGEDERQLIKVTVKVLLHQRNVSHLNVAVETALTHLKISYFDSVICSLPSISEEESSSFKDIVFPYWAEMEKFQSSGVARNISSSDLDRQKLLALMEVAKVKPEINQVNLASCCHMPEDLVAYAKEVSVVLHTHGDEAVMLPDEKLNELMKTVESSNNLHWKTNWVVRFAVVIKCRGIIKSKGYIASLQSEER